ncbi:MAG: lipoyl synthase [Proteobacteria bacterium]|nr:lipoyl synthase [Pseudomonadota bacterium]
MAEFVDESTSQATEKPLHVGKPPWLKTPIPTGETFFNIKRDLRGRKLFTVCEEAKCPNIAGCWSANTATFMVLGEVCTRGCRFCNVKTGNPNGWLDADEPTQVAESVALMKLKYVVITMVDRDDLPDGGAAHVAKVIRIVKDKNPGIIVELLAGDFRGSDFALATILAERPEVYAHNIETVERLSPRVRDARANYRQSLRALKQVKEIANYPVFTKSAIMLGLGEDEIEVQRSLLDLREIGCDFINMGQYMRPTNKHLSIKRFAHPDEFSRLEQFAIASGFIAVASAPLVRSSYKANEYYGRALAEVARAKAQASGQQESK